MVTFPKTKVLSSMINAYYKVNISGLLYALVGLLVACLVATMVSRYIMNKSLQQQKTAEHLMFEITYGHNFIVRDVDVTVRGFGIINDERYLYRSNEYIKIDLENNFQRLDSLLASENYSEKNGIKAIERYKYYIRSFVDYHRAMIELIREGQQEKFEAAFSRDSSATMWPVFTRAVEVVSEHERLLSTRAYARYNFFSAAVVYVQILTLALGIPLVSMIFSRLRNERRTAKLLEERKLIDERNKIKENILSVMSHEIRTPLNSMIGLTHVLRRRDPRPDQIEIIDTLKTSSDHLLHLVNDVLDYNRIQAGKLDLEFLNFNLLETLKQVHSMFVRSAEEKGIRFSVQINTSMPTMVKGDATRLLQILSNLISNAIKFTSKGTVTLYARHIGETTNTYTVEFKVEDTGIGIPPEKLPLLYEPFTQFQSPSTRKYGGSGLGLLIVKSLTEAMKGNVNIVSVPGETTAITVIIPFVKEESPSGISQSSAESPMEELSGIRVLYTEDVESNQFLVKALLDDHAIECTIANNAKETMKHVVNEKFDIILLDVQLPDMNGYELAKQIRGSSVSKNKNTPIILFSAHTGMDEETIRNCGADDYLGKPFQPDDLLAKISKHHKTRNK
jgi:signal transduction histidine kinase/ActR/RegA family two-component response regulator